MVNEIAPGCFPKTVFLESAGGSGHFEIEIEFHFAGRLDAAGDICIFAIKFDVGVKSANLFES